MDSSQDNNFGNAMPSGGGVGVDSGVNPSVGVDSGVNPGVEVGMNQPMAANVGQPMPASVGQPMAASAGQPVSTMNQGQSAMPVNPVQPVIPIEQGQSVVLDGLGQQTSPLGQGQSVMPNGLGQQMAPVSQVQPIGSGNLGQQMSPMGQEQSIVSNSFSQPMSPMGMNMNMMNQSIPMSDDTGDIILNTDEGKKSKKWWIVGGVLGLVAIAAAVAVGLWLKPWEWSGRNDDSGFKETIKESFDKYANYLVNGRVSKEPLEEEYIYGRSYALGRAINTLDYDYFEKLADYWSDFWQMYDNQDVIAVDGIIRQNDMMDFMITYYKEAYITDYDLLKRYNNEGSDVIRSYISREYEKLEKMEYGLADDFAIAMKNKLLSQIDLYDIYAQGGCIIEDRLDYDCIDSLQAADDTKAKLRELLMADDIGIIDSAVENILRNSLRISKEMKNV